MIKFFRHIRKDLMETGKTKKYIKYAVGEIILVVIGILIALSINNWNNDRQNQHKGISYLEGIKHDLENDAEFMMNLIPYYDRRLKQYDSLDALVKAKSSDIYDVKFQKFMNLTYQAATFYPIIGSYSSLISENSNTLIPNQELFKQIKNIYEIQYVRVSSLGLELDAIATQLKYDLRLDFRHKLAGYTLEDYDALFADLGEMHRNVLKYRRRLDELLTFVNDGIKAIDVELNKN